MSDRRSPSAIRRVLNPDPSEPRWDGPMHVLAGMGLFDREALVDWDHRRSSVREWAHEHLGRS